MIRNYILTALMLLYTAGNSQEQSPQMADTMRSDGKIYVVIAVLAAIFACLIVFLVYIERKVERLEKKLNSQSSKP